MITPPIKKYVMDPGATWEERYRQLEAHHEKETQWYAKALDSPPRVSSDDMAHHTAVLEEAIALHKGTRAYSFQARVKKWSLACFGEAIAMDRTERNHRFLEESLELVQALGCTASEAHQLVDYVFGRPVGEVEQELGGVMVTLAALCNANDLDRDVLAEVELERVWEKIEKIREKQKQKPKHSPLPQAASAALSGVPTGSRAGLARPFHLVVDADFDVSMECITPGARFGIAVDGADTSWWMVTGGPGKMGASTSGRFDNAACQALELFANAVRAQEKK